MSNRIKTSTSAADLSARTPIHASALSPIFEFQDPNDLDSGGPRVPAALWLRVSGNDQPRENQLPHLTRFAAHPAYQVVTRYELDESAWDDGSRGYRETLARGLVELVAGHDL